jgi:RimJ/RimL family protein N-acetyltransferase
MSSVRDATSFQLPGGQVYLRVLQPGDLHRLHRWHNDASLYEHLTGAFRPVALADEQAWLDRARRPSDTARNFAVCVARDDRHVGVGYLREIDRAASTADLHCFIGDAAERGKGYGRGTVEALMGYARAVLELDRLRLEVLAENEVAIALYRSCGFKVEAGSARTVGKRDRPVEIVVMRAELRGLEALARG